MYFSEKENKTNRKTITERVQLVSDSSDSEMEITKISTLKSSEFFFY